MSIIESSNFKNDISIYTQPLKLESVKFEDIKTITCLDLECSIYVGQEYKDYINVSRWACGSKTYSNWYLLKKTQELINLYL